MAFVAFIDKTNQDVDKLVELSLPCPRSNRIAIYFHNHLNQLFEIQRVTGPGRKSSWLIDGNMYKDGAVRFISPIDPLFICLPMLERASVGNQFRTLDDIFTRDNVIIERDEEDNDDDRPIDVHRLINFVSEDQLKHLCDVQDVGVLVYRLNEDLVLNWLVKKVNRVLANDTFKRSFEQTGQTEEYMKLEAVYTIANYLSQAWFKKLLNKMGLEEVKEEQQNELTNYATDISPTSYFKRTSYEERMMDADTPKKKKAAVPRSLAKVNTKGMKTLTSFFTKK
ncbi:hypothetical protein RMATCC62417_11906 [Rhizopus microsporus]|nr:hypothetical protein RMATCC62417_11906 [Rhizopus microsporus]